MYCKDVIMEEYFALKEEVNKIAFEWSAEEERAPASGNRSVPGRKFLMIRENQMN